MKRCLPVLASVFAAFMLPDAAPARAAESALPNSADSVLQQELKQQQLKTTTRKVGEQLEAIVAEFDRNGIQGEDVKVLSAIRSVLDRLSQQDMEKVIAFLQQTRAASDPADSARHATEAFAGQKTIITLNGKVVNSFEGSQEVPPRKQWYEPVRGPRPDSGYVGLQNHDGRSKVQFREVSVSQ